MVVGFDHKVIMCDEHIAAAHDRTDVRPCWQIDVLDRPANHLGTLFIAMRHSFDHSKNFDYKQPVDQAISDAFGAMVRQRMAA